MRILDAGAHFGDGVVAPNLGVTLSIYAAAAVLPFHEHTSAHLCLVLAGGYGQTSVAGDDEVRPGKVAVHCAGERHSNRFGATGAKCLNIDFASDAEAGAPGIVSVSARIRTAAEHLAAQVALGTEADRLTAMSLLAEIIGAALSSEETMRDVPLQRVLDALDDAPEQDWSLDDLAAIAGRHPTHLARAFRSATGMPIGVYRRQRRLRALCIDLRRDNATLSELAQKHGYSDQAHMTREFRAFAGIAPGQWRRQVLAAQQRRPR